jgi:hypothetical protein
MSTVAEMYALALKHHQAERLQEAEKLYKQALEIDSRHADSHHMLGIAKFQMGRCEEAITSIQRALALNPHADAYSVNLRLIHRALLKQAYDLKQHGRLDESLALYELALRCDPNCAETHFQRAVLWMLKGHWEQGFAEYEWRWQTKNYGHFSIQQPRWDGSPLGGKTIFVFAEQGLGDTMHFISYLPLIQRRGGRVILQCLPQIVPLLAHATGIDQLLARDEPLPGFDVYVPLLSLPGIFNSTLQQVPQTVPYLHAEAELVKYWKVELQEDEGGRTKDKRIAHSDSSFVLHPSSFRIGIAWQGSPGHLEDRLRSIPLTQFARLSELEGIQLISLQKAHGTEELERMRDEGGRMKPEQNISSASSFILHLTSFLIDEAAGAFMDTAAIMMNLDLVICCDTSVAHLAGALGVPVWVALPLAPDWRWLLERDDSPWYPTMRLFRQTRYASWDDVFERIAEELANVLRRGNVRPGLPVP